MNLLCGQNNHDELFPTLGGAYSLSNLGRIQCPEWVFYTRCPARIFSEGFWVAGFGMKPRWNLLRRSMMITPSAHCDPQFHRSVAVGICRKAVRRGPRTYHRLPQTLHRPRQSFGRPPTAPHIAPTTALQGRCIDVASSTHCDPQFHLFVVA